MKRIWTFLALLTILALAPLAGSQAQERPGAARRQAEIGREMQKLFNNQLRAELALTDDQMEAIGPRIERLETARREARRERIETVQKLRRGFDGGLSDDELQALLDRLDAIEQEQRGLERTQLSMIDEELSTRQRVELRFFMEQFRQDMARKVQELRGNRGDGVRRRGPRQGRR
jgi:hypothetical protein